MQYGHCTACATARAMSDFSFAVRLPSLKTSPYQAKNFSASPCWNSAIFTNLAKIPTFVTYFPPMQQILEKIEQTVHDLTEQGFAGADTAMVLGTGLGSLLHHVDVKKSISFQEIRNFPVATVEFHKGNLIL